MGRTRFPVRSSPVMLCHRTRQPAVSSGVRQISRKSSKLAFCALRISPKWVVAVLSIINSGWFNKVCLISQASSSLDCSPSSIWRFSTMTNSLLPAAKSKSAARARIFRARSSRSVIRAACFFRRRPRSFSFSCSPTHCKTRSQSSPSPATSYSSSGSTTGYQPWLKVSSC